MRCPVCSHSTVAEVCEVCGLPLPEDLFPDKADRTFASEEAFYRFLLSNPPIPEDGRLERYVEEVIAPYREKWRLSQADASVPSAPEAPPVPEAPPAASPPQEEPVVQQGDFRLRGTVLVEYTGPGGDVVIPPGVTVIGHNAFYGCTGLSSVAIPEGITAIRSGAFYRCEKLTRITIHEGVTRIGANAFAGCTGLTGIVIPNGVTHIDANAFGDCKALTCVTIPASVTAIGAGSFPRDLFIKFYGHDIFGHCDALKEIRLGKGSPLDRRRFPSGVSVIIVD